MEELNIIRAKIKYVISNGVIYGFTLNELRLALGWLTIALKETKSFTEVKDIKIEEKNLYEVLQEIQQELEKRKGRRATLLNVINNNYKSDMNDYNYWVAISNTYNHITNAMIITDLVNEYIK